jgi:hypothetical protein
LGTRTNPATRWLTWLGSPRGDTVIVDTPAIRDRKTGRDTHLDRFVALKTLSAEKLADPERKRRFVQEAKAASALNHPNIVHIYDIAEADGVQ